MYYCPIQKRYLIRGQVIIDEEELKAKNKEMNQAKPLPPKAKEKKEQQQETTFEEIPIIQQKEEVLETKKPIVTSNVIPPKRILPPPKKTITPFQTKTTAKDLFADDEIPVESIKQENLNNQEIKEEQEEKLKSSKPTVSNPFATANKPVLKPQAANSKKPAQKYASFFN